jgi:hypothetical protein
MVLNTLNIITPIGFPGIMNPARKGEMTFSAGIRLVSSISESYFLLTKHNVRRGKNHASGDLNIVSDMPPSVEGRGV